MSKTKKELNALKKEVEAVNEKLQVLSKEELEKVNGGVGGLVHGVRRDIRGVVVDGN